MNKRINTTSKLRAESGFTLIEIMIVIAIMGVLLAIAIPSYQGYIKTTKFVTLKVAIKQMIAAQDRYYLENDIFFPRPEKKRIIRKPNVETDWAKLGMFFPESNKYKVTMKSGVRRRLRQHTLTMTIDIPDDLNGNGKPDRIIYVKRIKGGNTVSSTLVWKR